MASCGGQQHNCLTEDEIISFVFEIFNLTLYKDQLANPSQVVVSNLYELLLEDLGVSGFTQPDLTATQDIQNIERYVDFMAMSNIRLCIAELLSQTGYPGEFTLLDMIQPKRKKVLRILSHLIRLWTETDDIRKHWESKSADLEAKEKERQKLKDRLNTLQKSLEKKVEQASACRALKEELEKKLEAASRKYTYQKDRGEELHEQYRLEKSELVGQREKLSELQVQVGKLREQIAEQEALIVRSPEKVTAETDAMQVLVSNKMSEKRRLQQDYVEAMNAADTVVRAQKELKPAIDTLRETFTDLETLREKCSVAEDMKAKVLSLAQKDREMTVVAEQCNNNAKELQNQLKKNRMQFRNQMNPLRKMNEDLLNDIKSKQEGCSGSSDQQKHLLQQEMALIQRREQLHSDRQLNDCQFAASYQKIAKAVLTAIDTKTLLK